jgi:hypothetical protein
MRLYLRVVLGLALFLVGAAMVYGVIAGERAGLLLLGVAGLGLLYVGWHVWRALGRGARAERLGEPAPAEEEPHVTPTLWPLVLSLAAASVVAGVLGARWLLLVAALLLLVAAAGWFHDIRSQRARP